MTSKDVLSLTSSYMVRMRIANGAIALAALLISTIACWAQNTGTIRGVVTDPSAAVVPGAMVVAAGNGITRSVRADNQGRYNVLNVPPGKYNLRVEAKGFVP